jgi:hypothetical protein
MKAFRMINLLWIGVFGLVIVFVGTVVVNAQSRREIERERQRQIQRYERQRRSDVYIDRSERLPNRTVNTLLLQGYENGLRAGRMDRSRGKFNASNVYRNTPARPYNGDSSSADYLYRQGYLEGYEDGYYGRLRY